MGVMPEARIPLFINGIRAFILLDGQLLDYFFSGLIIFIIHILKSVISDPSQKPSEHSPIIHLSTTILYIPLPADIHVLPWQIYGFSTYIYTPFLNYDRMFPNQDTISHRIRYKFSGS